MKNISFMIAALVATGAIGSMAVTNDAARAEMSQQARQASQPRAQAAIPVPAAVIKNAIATRSDKTGKVASAALGNTGYYIVYLKTQRGCGSGGCKAQIWKKQGNAYVQAGSLPASFLPVRSLGQNDNGLPRLGITNYTSSGKAVVYSVSFNGREYGEPVWSKPLPANTGKAALTESMLKSF